MKDNLILRIASKLLIPFILVFALYVQIHGEVSAGGGFQAGVIFASAFILFCLIYGIKRTLKILSLDELRILSGFGVMIYTLTGFSTMLMGGKFLDYNLLAKHPVAGQKLGIILVEAGVGITVFSVMLMIFLVFVARKN